MKITITKDGNTLIAQGTGQPAFPLEATDKDKFKFDQAGAKFEFNPTGKKMILYYFLFDITVIFCIFLYAKKDTNFSFRE